MAMTQAIRLGCGRDIDDVWDHIDQPPSEHEQTCPYCTAARADLSELSAATHELVEADREDPDLRVPDGMLSDVLSIVRTEVRRGRTIPLVRRNHGRQPSGVADNDTAATGGTGRTGGLDDRPQWGGSDEPSADLTVSELVVATVVREVCDRNPDVEVRRVSIQATPSLTSADARPASDAGTPPGTPGLGSDPAAPEPADVSIELQALVSHNVAIPAVLQGLRRAIQAAIAAQIGLTVSRIDIDIKDLIDV